MHTADTTTQMSQHPYVIETAKDTTSHPGTSQGGGMVGEAEAFDLSGSQVAVISHGSQDGQVPCAQRLPQRGQAPPPDTR